MNLQLKKLTPALARDFLHFFDHEAFSDHEEWAGCYCLESHLTREENERLQPFDKVRDIRRQLALEMVEQGLMTGYLVYDGEAVVGWCNVGDKLDYLPVCQYEPLVTEPHERGKIKLLYCFDIAAAYRGKGVAKLIIERVLADAKQEGYLYVEAHPSTDRDFPYQYRGPLKLYQQYGFEILRELEWCYVMRKTL